MIALWTVVFLVTFIPPRPHYPNTVFKMRRPTLPHHPIIDVDGL